MERQEKGGSTYFFLALVTLAFLAAVLYLTFGANRTEQEGYTVQTERARCGRRSRPCACL